MGRAGVEDSTSRASSTHAGGTDVIRQQGCYRYMSDRQVQVRIECSNGDTVLIALLCIILLNSHMYVGQSHMGVSVMVGSQVNIRVNSLDEPSNTRDL